MGELSKSPSYGFNITATDEGVVIRQREPNAVEDTVIILNSEEAVEIARFIRKEVKGQSGVR